MPVSILSKTLQSDEIDILEALTGVLRTLKEIDKLLSKPVAEWSTYKSILQKCEDEVYQLQELKTFSTATQYFENNGGSCCKLCQITAKMVRPRHDEVDNCCTEPTGVGKANGR